MRPQFHFSNALGYTFAELTEMHNASFTGYFFPAKMTPEANAEFWRIYQIDARACVVMHAVDGAFAGMARVGVRGKRAWCGGFGIAPAFRGMGASHQLAAQMVAVAREMGLASFQLEVLTQNAAAIKVYEHAGFAIRRRIVGLEIATDALPIGDGTQPQSVPLTTLLPVVSQYAHLNWQRELPTMLSVSALAATVTHADGTTSSVIYRQPHENVHILTADLAASLSLDTFGTLLRGIAGNATKVYLSDEPETTRLYDLSVALGFTTFFNQYEMFLTL